MDYIGEKCPVCNKIFTPDDDIVVCPECGTPHHRDCYAANGKCAHEEYHFIGRRWEKKADDKPRYRICPVCRFPNGSNDTSCQRCGTDLRDVSADTAEESRRNAEQGGSQWRDPFGSVDSEELIDPINYLGYDPDEDIGGATMREASDFVGPNNIYYLPKFKRMHEDGVRPSFNILGLFFPSLLFANRRMWGWAIITVVIGTILSFPSDLALYMQENASQLPAEFVSFMSEYTGKLDMLGDIGMVLSFAGRALCCLFANWLYYRFSMRSIKKIKTRRRPLSEIKNSGGIKPLNAVLIILIRYGVALTLVSAVYFLFAFVFSFKEVYNM
ncbi:RING finger protein [Ruminococcus flavefaciens]|uniref:RING finger protein n=1 Tax=Ruminococcus flavefaciens TaxID=1265 RepID=UPI00048B80D5|nr:RING finger protein [Ruminococcus flavefaciens]